MVMEPSAATRTTGLERLLLIFLMKTQQTKVRRTKSPSATIDPTINRLEILKLPKTSANATATARR